ncbi:calcium ion binding [Ascochyta rabiei]|uniref:alpha-1,2-Mannosidase n=2 Tax=Didymella rabiei TaxID=5454 RepID=A0A163J3G2_DIDRA|nr:calcium ion binding [Ascochyta rabiei]
MFIKRWRYAFVLATVGIFVIIVTTLSTQFALPTRNSTHPTLNHESCSSATETRPGMAACSESNIASSHACPTVPPSTALQPDTQDRFDWRAIPVHHPVDKYVQLPSEESVPKKPIQHTFESPTSEAKAEIVRRQTAVKRVFKRGWQSYRDRAWTQDELTPISGSARTTFGGWGATLVDSLDTLWIMGMEAEFAEAVDAALQIDFSPSGSGDVNMFEIIIRYLGGFIGAYDISGCHDSRLLRKALEVADMAYASFDTSNRMPVSRWNTVKAAAGEEQLPMQSGLIAEHSSAGLEFSRLSQLTGDMRYFDAISRVTDVLDSQQGKTKLPGMWPVVVDMSKPDLTGSSGFTLGAMADSTYEYLPKMYQLLSGKGTVGAQYRKMYEYSMATAIEHTLFRPMVEDKADILVATGNNDGKKDNIGQHLICFAGGMLALGGQIFENHTHLETGRRLTDGCAWAYKNAPNGIMPELYTLEACPTLSECEYVSKPSSKSESDPFSSVPDGRYILRPETIESVFYMYRITGERRYQDIAWDMFQAIENSTQTEFANAAIRDVMKNPPEKEDSMESFWMAETLKYFYLIFSDPSLVSLDDFVFNTEAHPFRIPLDR